jgi:hypothetical protein
MITTRGGGMKPGDKFRDKHNLIEAEVVAIDGDTISLERYRLGSSRRKRFQLPRWFFDSKACGWIPVIVQREEGRGAD